MHINRTIAGRALHLGMRCGVALLMALMLVAVGVLAAHPGWHAALHPHAEVSTSQDSHSNDEGAGGEEGCAVCGWIHQHLVMGSPSIALEVVPVVMTTDDLDARVVQDALEQRAPGDPRGPPDWA